MSLEDESRQEMIALYIEKADEFWAEAAAARQLGMWSMTVNRIYYSLLNAVRALLVKDRHPAYTHDGIKTLFGQHYVITGKVTNAQGRLFSQMETLRQRSDYDCHFKANKELVEEKFEPVKELISRIKEIITEVDNPTAI